MKRFMILMMVVGCLVITAITAISYAEQHIIARKVARAPVIDGNDTDSVWAHAKKYTVYDEVAKIDVTLKAVYTDTEIFFLVSYPDTDKSNTHKSWVWDKTMEMYRSGPDREDTFVFKWNMEANPVDISLKADNDYMADIWFWKACRTNPTGYADDKYHRLSVTKMPKVKRLTSKTGSTMYLARRGDSGRPAYEDVLYGEYKDDIMHKFNHTISTGSRADIKAKGVWSDGRWQIEFRRALKTGGADDIQFDTSKSYLFGVSRYEIAGKKPDPEINQPLYGSGDVGEKLTLSFGK